MTPTIGTWSELGRRSGNVLLVVNTPDGGDEEVEAAYERLTACAEAVHVIAPSAWSAWVTARGVTDDRSIYARDETGAEFDLNHFLESAVALRWIEAKRFALVTGSAPHSVYNEEVKEIFEQRVALFLGRGLFVAHALPQPYVYVFEQPAMFARQARRSNVARYNTLCLAIVDDCYRVWQEQQKPAASDDAGSADLLPVFSAHLGAAFLDFDEASAIPVPPEHAARSAADAAVQFAGFASRLYRRLTDMSRMYEERASAVALRDEIIDGLRRELETPLRRLRRWLRQLVRE